MRDGPSRSCPACGKTVIRQAGLYRCTCGKSFDGDLPARPRERRSDTYTSTDNQSWLVPIDGRPVPLDRRIKD